MPTPDGVRQLVQRFDEHKDVCPSPGYNEAQKPVGWVGKVPFIKINLPETTKIKLPIKFSPTHHLSSFHFETCSGGASRQVGGYPFRHCDDEAPAERWNEV